MNDTKSKARTVNATIGKQPNIGPFPADQLIPWVVISGLSYYLFYGFLRLNWVWTLALAIWGMSTWWVLTANGAWRILSKFLATPNWTRVRVLYEPILQPNARKKGRKHKDKSRK